MEIICNFLCNLDARLNYNEIKIYCDMGEVECFFKCLNNTKCLSFAVAMNANFTETACFVYSKSKINDHYFLHDITSTYYFMVCSS